jgi:23S rRNA pseudouridine1911/1915/1917 synthase
VDGTRHFDLGKQHHGLRLDEALALLAPELSRARLQKLVRRGRVRVRGKLVRRSNGRVNRGDRIELEGESEAPGPAPLEVLHLDEHLLAINKPSGLLTHPAPGKTALSLAELADAQFGPLPTGAGIQRPGIVHRLDRETSGVILLARTDLAMEDLK